YERAEPDLVGRIGVRLSASDKEASNPAMRRRQRKCAQGLEPVLAHLAREGRKSNLAFQGSQEQGLLGPIHQPGQTFLGVVMRGTTVALLDGGTDMPVHLVRRIIELRDGVERDDRTQFLDQNLE